MSITSPKKRKLEELPHREIPKELSPLYPVVLDTLSEAITKGQSINSLQREFCRLYTMACIDKGAELRLPLAAEAYVDLKAKPDRNADDNDDLQRLVAALKALPKQEMDGFVGLVKKLTQAKQAAPEAVVMNAASPLSPDKGADVGAGGESSKECISKMQACLKGIGEHAVANYNEAVSQAQLAISSFPKNPDVVLQAAICFHARAGRDKDRTADERVQDLEKAQELMEEFLIITHKPPYNKLPEYQKRREAVTEKWNEIRQLVHEQKHPDLSHKKPPEQKKPEPKKTDGPPKKPGT